MGELHSAVISEAGVPVSLEVVGEWRLDNYEGSIPLPRLLEYPEGTMLSAFPSASEPPRRWAVLVVKAVHTAWFALVSTSIIHIFVVGLLNRPSRWTRPALVATALEVAVFLANAGHCPLTGLAEQLGASSGRVSDIFLPRWFADRIPQIYTPPLIIGVAAMVVHWWRGRRCRNQEIVST